MSFIGISLVILGIGIIVNIEIASTKLSLAREHSNHIVSYESDSCHCLADVRIWK